MTIIALPYSPVDGDPEDISEIMANFNAILAVVNGDLKNDNCAADMALVASKIVLDTDGTLAANSDTKIPSQKAIKTYADLRMLLSYLDTDGTLAADSDTKVATQKAVKTYADALSLGIAGTLTPYTPDVVLGWSSYTGSTFKYLKLTAKAVLLCYKVVGTSNNAAAYFSTPSLGSTKASSSFRAAAEGCDNGIYTPSLYAIISTVMSDEGAGSNKVTLVKDENASGWTASGTKNVSGQIIYELA